MLGPYIKSRGRRGTKMSANADLITVETVQQGETIWKPVFQNVKEICLVCWSLTSLCHSNGYIETMPAREINPFTALTRIRSQFLRTQWRAIISEWTRPRLRLRSNMYILGYLGALRGCSMIRLGLSCFPAVLSPISMYMSNKEAIW